MNRGETRLACLLAISESVRHLVVGWQTTTDGHRVQHPGLLRQARAAVLHSTPGHDESDRKVHAKPTYSRPPMPEHVWYVLLEAETDVRALAASYGLQTNRGEVESVLRELVGKATTLTDRDLDLLDRDLAALVQRLELALAWRFEDRRIRGLECPACSRKGKIFVQFDQAGQPANAKCRECGAWWSRSQFGLLAEYINNVKEESS